MRQEFRDYCMNHGVNGAYQQYDVGLSAIETEFNVSVDLEFAKDKCESLSKKIVENVRSIRGTDTVVGNRRNWISYLKKYVEFKTSLSIQYWVFSPGQNAGNWESDYSNKRMSIGFIKAGDLSQYRSIDEIRSKVYENNRRAKEPESIMNFLSVKPGDCVFVRNGLKWIIGFGVVKSQYKHSDDGSEFPNYYEVEWFSKYNCSFDFTNFKGQFPPTIFKIEDEERIASVANAISNIVGEDKHSGGSEQNESVSSEKTDQQLPKYKFLYSYRLLESKNVIFHGAPGTGKSFLAKEIAADIVSGGKTKDYDNNLSPEQKKQVEFVQFHPSYDYSDFVEGLRPIKSDKGIDFELKNGIFKTFVNVAKENPNKPFVFIIDEINRGEISKIFGELFYSVEPSKRGMAGEISTQYANMHPDEPKFYIPENLYIIGTMNDIDRSVDTFDFAMRRRFTFIEITAEESQKMLDGIAGELKEEAKARMNRLNKAISNDEFGLNSNYHIGAAYFMDVKGKEDFDLLWTDKLKPLLQEYVVGMYNQSEAMAVFEDAYFSKTADTDFSQNVDQGASDENTQAD